MCRACRAYVEQIGNLRGMVNRLRRITPRAEARDRTRDLFGESSA